MRYRDINSFRPPSYQVDVGWAVLDEQLARWMREKPGLNLDPDFQRGHVWTPEQQTAYIEFILMGGSSGKEVYFNCPGWMDGTYIGPFEIVDGKQRINAVLDYMRGKVTIFNGLTAHDFEDKPDILVARFRFHVNHLESRAEVLRWYLALNTGGTIHTPEEIARVRALLEKEA